MPRRAQRQPHANLARPALRGIRQHPIQSHRRQQRGQYCKSQRQHRQRSLVRRADIHLRLHRPQAVHHQRRIEVVHRPLNPGFRRLRILRGAQINLHPARMFDLRVRPIHSGTHIRAQVLVLHISHHAHNRRIRFVLFANQPSQRILRRTVELLYKRQVHDRDLRRVFPVALGEVTPHQQRLVDRGKIPRRDPRIFKVRVLPLDRLVPLHNKSALRAVAHQFRIGRRRGQSHSRNPPQPIQRCLYDLRSAILAVSRDGRIKVECRQMARVESDRLIPQMLERAHKQPCSAQQQHAQRDLHANRRLPEVLGTLRRRPCTLPQRPGEIGPQEVQRRRDRKQHAHHHRKAQREQQHPPVHARRIRLASRVGARHQTHQCDRQQRRQRQPARCARRAQQPSFNQQLPHDAAAPRAQGVAHRHLPHPRRRPQQQQRRHIQRAHRHQQPRHAQQNHQRRLELHAVRREPHRVVLHFYRRLIDESCFELRRG